MSLIQVRDANWRVPYTGGWCLKYVQDAFGTDHPYANAMAAWNANFGGGNHPNELPPVGKTVVVYFSLGNVPEGHAAISLDDGTVASSTQAGTHPQGYLHPNLNNLISVYGQYNGGCHYLGWSEFVGTVRVVENSTPNITLDDLNIMYRDILERPKQPNGNYADDGAIAHYVGHFTNDFVRTDLLASNEYKILQNRKAADAAKAITDKAAADAEAARVAKAAADAQAAAQAETDRLAKVAADKVAADAETARLKALQDAADAKKLADAQLADAKARADVALQTAPNPIAAQVARLTIQNILTWLYNFIKQVIGAK